MAAPGMLRLGRKSRLLASVTIVVVAPFAATTIAQAGPSADALVFVGSGRLGTWETNFALANGSASELGARVGVSLDFPEGCPITGCPGYQFVALAPNGSADLATPGLGPLDAIYIRGSEGDILPVANGRTTNSASPYQSADVPGFRLSTLLNLNAAVLSFPGAGGVLSRSNLVLTNLLTFEPPPIRGGEIRLHIEAFDSAGEVLGSTDQVVSVGETVLLQNIYGALGGTGSGQIRVTRIGGDRAFWGILYTFDENGGVTANAPLNP